MRGALVALLAALTAGLALKSGFAAKLSVISVKKPRKPCNKNLKDHKQERAETLQFTVSFCTEELDKSTVRDIVVCEAYIYIDLND